VGHPEGAVAASVNELPSALDVLGFPVNALSTEDVWRAIDQVLSKPEPTRCLHVVTLNPEYVMAAREDADFAAALKRAGLVTADGVGVALAARLNGRGKQQVERVTGVDILQHLGARSRDDGAPLFLLGAGPSVAGATAESLQTQFPGARIAGLWSEGSARPADDNESLERIRASGARAVAVAYGARAQVLWIDRNLDALSATGVCVAVGVGGAFDFVAGRVPRAPRLMQRLGLEWLYRLVREPWRWRRQLVLPHFALLVLREHFFGGSKTG
jgi:N-acetylglucosaminyldiphosphoundecaprenol N-acetyl-beta-D-mannosaminyltransferase